MHENDKILYLINYTDIKQQQFELFSYISKNYKKLNITWEKIAHVLEEYLQMGDLAEEVRRKHPQTEGINLFLIS